jgi:putative DNA primase/helicase
MVKILEPINVSEKEISEAQTYHNVSPIRPIQYISPISMINIAADIPPPKQYALYPIIPIQGIVFIFAASGVGKTMFTLNIGYSIAAGGNFLKYTAPKPRRVLYIDGEMAYVDIHSRTMQIVNQQGKLDFPENFMIYTPDKLILPEKTETIRMPKICQPEGQMFYEMAIEKNDIDVIVIDNLSMLSTIDLDKSHEWHIINDWLLSLRTKGKTIIVVHHSGKDKEGYRGTSRMLDAVDTAISLQAIEDLLPDQSEETSPLGKRFKIVYKKNRSFFGSDAHPYEVTFLNERWSHRTIELSVMDKIIECASANMNQRDIAKELIISQSTVNRMIKKARKQGLIRD